MIISEYYRIFVSEETDYKSNLIIRLCLHGDDTKRNETEQKRAWPRIVFKLFTRKRQIVLNRLHENGKRAFRLELARAGLAQGREEIH